MIRKDEYGNLVIREATAWDQERHIGVHPTRTGVYVGCTFVTYEAFDEIVKLVNKSPDHL